MSGYYSRVTKTSVNPSVNQYDAADLDRSLPRTRWKYQGRRERDGEQFYLWHRELPDPHPVTGYQRLAFAMPVATFWPH